MLGLLWPALCPCCIWPWLCLKLLMLLSGFLHGAGDKSYRQPKSVASAFYFTATGFQHQRRLCYPTFLTEFKYAEQSRSCENTPLCLWSKKTQVSLYWNKTTWRPPEYSWPLVCASNKKKWMRRVTTMWTWWCQIFTHPTQSFKDGSIHYIL